MPKVETNTRKILARLAQEGWTAEGGSKHTKLANPAFPGIRIMVPRHTELTDGVARSIAKAAGWL